MSPSPPASTEPAARPPSPRRVLSREQILEAAIALVDRGGLERTTMRSLAEELGVGAMTLYSYFSSKDELLDAAVEHVAASVALPAQTGPWQDQVRRLVRGIYRFLSQHPAGVELRLKRPILTRGALRTTEAGLQILLAAGFSRAEAARAWRTLFVYAFGYAAFNPPTVSAGTQREWEALLAGLPPDEFPALSGGAAQAVATMSGEEQFEHGLDRLLAGFEAARG